MILKLSKGPFAVLNHSAFALLAATLLIATIQGKDSGPLSINLQARQVTTNAAGQVKFSSADKSKPGDTIQYEAVCLNRGKTGLSQIKPVIPIPSGMEYIPGSGSPKPIEASLDGRNFSAIPLKRKIKKSDGSEAEEETPASEYRAVRWNIGTLEAGQSTNLSVRVRVSPAGGASR